MLKSGDITYENKQALRGKFKQQGAFSYNSLIRRPKLAQLRLFERMRQDVTIKSGLSARILWLLNTIGEIEHPDPEIAEFHNNNLKQLEDDNGFSWKSRLQIIEETKCWAGNSVSEIMFKLKNGSLYLEDIITYDPKSIVIFPDKRGRLVQGKETYDAYHTSGIWQYAQGPNYREVQLDLWKHIHIVNQGEFANHQGISMFEPSYLWYRYKEALLDMMALALDNEGKRMLAITAPSYKLPDTQTNPSTGEEEQITSLELIKNQIDSADGYPMALYLPYQTPDQMPEIESISVQDKVSEYFMRAIEYADAQSVKHIIPAFLISSAAGIDSDSSVRERQLEMFSNNIEVDRANLLAALVKKVFMPIQQWNFNRESANIPPTFTRCYSDRAEDRLATMQVVKGLTDSAWLNPYNQQDYTKVMQMLRLEPRERDENDKQFIFDMLIEPRRQKDPHADDVGPNGSGKSGRSTGSKPKLVDKKSPQNA
jgi:hypothetical protein